MPEHANVIEALAAIMAELPAIAKVPHPSESGRGLTYAYRGIEEITAEAQQLFAKHGVVPIPRVRHREVKDIIVNGNPWTDTFLEVDWTIHGPNMTSVEATTFGQGRDNSDKGTNKAMTQAFKYLLLPTLMISDKGDDNDGTNIEVDARTHTSYARDVGGTDEYETINGEQIPVASTGMGPVTRSGPPSDLATPKQIGYARKLMNDSGIGDSEGDAAQAWINANCPPWPGMFKNLTKKQAGVLIEQLK